jgi:sulfonate transport system substrate-binding protein
MHQPKPTRRVSSYLALLTAGVVLAVAGCSRNGEDGATPRVLRLGYQKWGTLNLLKFRRSLEQRFASDGIAVEWTAFPSGPPLLEALNAGSIDFGHAGDSPPIFAQAAGIPFVYVAASSDNPAGSALVVRTDSSLRTPGDLRGRRVGFTKGSSAHTLVLRVLTRAGLTFRDVETVYLSPADARAALIGGSIDAWAIWDPYLAAAQQSGDVRILVDGTGLVPAREFYLASAALARDHPELVDAVLEELEALEKWARGRASEIAGQLAPETGMEPDVLELAERRRRRFGAFPVTGAILADQQATANSFFDLGLLPVRIAVADAVRAVNSKSQ